MASAISSSSSTIRPDQVRIDHLRHRAAPGRDHGHATGHRLDHGEAERLVPAEGHQERAGAGEQLVPPGEVDLSDVDGVVAEQRFDVLGEEAALGRIPHLAGQADRHAGAAGHTDRAVGALLRRHPPQPGDVSAPRVFDQNVAVDIDRVRQVRRPRQAGCRIALRVRQRCEPGLGRRRHGPLVERRAAVGQRPVDGVQAGSPVISPTRIPTTPQWTERTSRQPRCSKASSA